MLRKFSLTEMTMSICRIYYLPDGSIIRKTPFFRMQKESETTAEYLTYQTEFLDNETLKRPVDILNKNKEVVRYALVGVPFEDLDDSELPSTKTDREKWRGSKSSGVHIDNSVVTMAEKRQAVKDARAVLLTKGMPTAKNVMDTAKLTIKLIEKDY